MTVCQVFVKTLPNDRLLLIKFRLECLLKDKMLSKKKKLRDIIATFTTRDFGDVFFPQQFAFWLIFQPRLKCNYGPFLYFPLSALFTAWVFLGFLSRNRKIFVQLSALFRETFPPLKHFATSNSRNILIIKSSRLSILTTFRLKVAEKFSWLSWNSLSRTFSLTYFLFLSWITGTNFQWYKIKNFCYEKMMGLISLYILLEQFLATLNILHLFSIQCIFPNTFLIHSVEHMWKVSRKK